MLPEKIAANEEISRTQAELGLAHAERRLPFLCECDELVCRTLVRLTRAEYEQARAVGRRYIVAEGHPYQGRVVFEGRGYVVVEEEA